MRALKIIFGIAAVVFLLLPIVATLLIADMIGAIFYVHIDNGFWNTDNGYE